MLVLADGVLPLLDLSETLGYPAADDAGYVVIVRGNGGRVALAVDQLVGQRELVTRPAAPHVGGEVALSGGAVLPDGSIALIVDCDALAARPAPRRRLPDSPTPPRSLMNLTDIQLDALREIANIGSGNAATALARHARPPGRPGGADRARAAAGRRGGRRRPARRRR